MDPFPMVAAWAVARAGSSADLGPRDDSGGMLPRSEAMFTLTFAAARTGGRSGAKRLVAWTGAGQAAKPMPG